MATLERNGFKFVELLRAGIYSAGYSCRSKSPFLIDIVLTLNIPVKESNLIILLRSGFES
jgi:hypothetical protein